MYCLDSETVAKAREKALRLKKFIVEISSSANQTFKISEKQDDGEIIIVEKVIPKLSECGVIFTDRLIATHGHYVFEHLSLGQQFDVLLDDGRQVIILIFFCLSCFHYISSTYFILFR